MKTKILLSTILLTISFSLLTSFSYAQWEWQNPLPQGNSLYDVEFTDENTGWAVGYYGTILFTNNGGENWEIYTSGIKKNLNSISFIDGQNGWIVGNEGLILNTNNGGVNWVGQNSVTSQDIFDCCFLDSNLGWAVGDTGLILRTDDGGDNWELKDSQTEFTLKSVCFTDPLNGWIVGNDIYSFETIILHTNDGGENWSEQGALPWGGLNHLNSIYFINNMQGWAVGVQYNDQGYPAWTIILHTIDGGINWESHDYYFGGMLTSVFFKDSMNGWAIGGVPHFEFSNYGFVLKTNNGGENWELLENAQSEERLNAFCFLDEDIGFYAGEAGIICASQDGGNNFFEQSTALSKKSLNSIFFINEYTGWIAGAYHSGNNWGSSSIILKSNNAGQSWDIINDSLNIDDPTIIFINENIGWIKGVTYYPGGIISMIYKTIDGGATWVNQYAGDSKLNSIWFSNQNDGWAVGGDNNYYNIPGLIINTSNGGADWAIQFSDSSNYFSSVSFTDNNKGWVVGSNGIIRNTVDGGMSWEEQQSGTDLNLYKVVFISPEVGWVVGSSYYSDVILYTTNGGNTWEESISGEDWGLSDIHFTDMHNGWAVGDHIVLYTQNGGISWEVYDEMLTDQLTSIWFTDPDNGWVVGNGGRILHTSNGGLTAVLKVKIPNSNLHLTNYPNPFNSKTTIEFSIQERSFATVSVYDLSGKLQEKVMSKNLTSGKHQREWNAEGLPVGIYFIKIDTDSSTAVRKVLKAN